MTSASDWTQKRNVCVVGKLSLSLVKQKILQWKCSASFNMVMEISVTANTQLMRKKHSRIPLNNVPVYV